MNVMSGGLREGIICIYNFKKKMNKKEEWDDLAEDE